MTENPPNEHSQHNLPIFSVTEISQALKRVLEDEFPRIRVRGEISGLKRAASGHLYFRLKDTDAVLDAVCWRGQAGRLSIAPEDGMEVVATGRITSYPGRSNYQIVVDNIELAGAGALLKLLEERRRKLTEEGLFDIAAKKELPFLPDVIGVVSSETGAVIRDILHRLADRFPRRVLLWPVPVQGTGAAEQVAAAIAGFNALKPGAAVPRPDLLIVARGGGSLEDLMAFNEEIVVRAAAMSEIPLISAIGHETDTTLIDFAADVRAPTPTAAAEMAVPVRADLLAQVAGDGARLFNAAIRIVGDGKVRLKGSVRGLPNLRRTVEDARQRLDDWDERLKLGLGAGLSLRRGRLGESGARMPHPGRLIAHARSLLDGETRALRRAGAGFVAQRRQRIGHAAALLESLSYRRILERGFALVQDAAGHAIASAGDVRSGMELAIRFHDGEARAVAAGASSGGKPGGPNKKRGPGGENDGQGTLL